MKRIFILLTVSLFSLSGFSQNSQATKEISIQKYNKEVLSRQIGENLCLFVFYSTTCPLCKNYTKTVKEITNKYEGQLSAYLIFSGSYSKKEVKEHLEIYNMSVNVIIDKKFRLADEFNALVTPEVVLYENENVLYQGAIDDWVVRLGMTKDIVTEHYLTRAIDLVIEGSNPEISNIKAIGCFIR